jgi:hypothetical protein
MRIAPGTVFRDVLIFMALVFLLSLLVRRFDRYVTLHKESFVHELDPLFFETIKAVQRHAGLAYQAVRVHTIASEDRVLKRSVKTIHQLLDEIEKKYTHNPASLAMLGPIGTASIVLKEKRLNEQLLTVALTINAVFATLLHKPMLSSDKKKDISITELIQINTIYAKEIKRIL